MPGTGRTADGPEPTTVRVVVLNYNGGELTDRCLAQLEAVEYPGGKVEIVCVDNASVDGSVERIEADRPGVIVRRLPANGGFPANNEGLRDLDGVRYVGLLNNDAFAEPGWLQPLVDALDDDPALGAVSSKLVLAPRFAEVRIESDGFMAGPHEPRVLGVKVRDVAVEGCSVFRQAHMAEGGWPTEIDRSGPFAWAGPSAVLHVPCPGGDHRPFDVVLTLEAPTTKTVRVSAGRESAERSSEAEVGPTSTTCTLSVDAEWFDVLNNVGSVVFEDGAGADRGWLERDRGQYDEPVEVFAWCGGSVLFRPEYLADVGLFDERFFLYYEDTDLSWRGRARGWRYRTVPTSVARHVHAASSVEGSEVFAFYVERNRLVMLLKNAPLPMFGRQLWRYLLVTASYTRRDVVGPLRGAHRPHTTVVRRRLRSLLGFLRLAPVMAADRRRLRRRQQVSDAELTGWLVRR